MYRIHKWILIHIAILISLIGQSTRAQTAEKEAYAFTDERVSMADSLASRSPYDSALVLYQDVLSTYMSEDFYEGQVYVLERMGRCYRKRKEFSLAAEVLDKAIDIARKKLPGDHMLLVKAYLGSSMRAHHGYDVTLASKLIDTALVLYDRSSTIERNLYLDINRYKFYTYLYSGISTDTLIKYAHKKAELAGFSSLPVTEQVYALCDFSLAYSLAGDYYKAATYSMKAIKLGRENLELMEPEDYAEGLFELSRAYVQIKDYQKAEDVLEEFRTYTEENVSDLASRINHLYLLAHISAGRKQFDKAIETYKKILNDPDIDKIPDKEPLISFEMNMGLCYVNKGEPHQGIPILQEALRKQKQLNIKSDNRLSQRYYYLAYAHDRAKNHELALQYIDSVLIVMLPSFKSHSLDFPKELERQPSSYLLKTFALKAKITNRLHKSLGKDSTALLNSVVDHVNEIHKYLLKDRSEKDMENSRLLLAGSFKSTYEAGIDASFQLYKAGQNSVCLSKMLENMAKSKSALFLEQYGEYDILNNHDLPYEHRALFAQAKMMVDSIEQRINELITTDPLHPSLLELNEDRMKYNADFQNLKERLESEYGSCDKLLSEQLSLPALRENHQLSRKRALVEYFVADDHIFFVGLNGEKQTAHKIERDSTFNAGLEHFLSYFNQSSEVTYEGNIDPTFVTVAQELYRQLLEPVLAELGTTEELILVTDDLLTRLPFDLLVVSDKGKESFKTLDYLMRNIRVSYLFSSRLHYDKSVNYNTHGLLGFAYSDEGVNNERSGFGGLPGSIDEINFLKAKYQGEFFMGPEGSKKKFLEKAGDYDIIHLALHGQSDPEDRYKSALVFNGSSNPQMTSMDLYQTHLKSRLVVLSACETGVGEIREGEGMFSIARGFAVAGVPAILTTLWNVNDRAAAKITTQFYHHLEAGRDKNEALRLAKLDYLADANNITAHPFYWGNYILIGDASHIDLPIKGTTDSNDWWWVTFVLLPGIVALGSALSRKFIN